MRRGWLLREGEVLASVDIADRPAERMRGLLGQGSFEGALLLPRTRSVHTLMMRFALDVAYLSADLRGDLHGPDGAMAGGTASPRVSLRAGGVERLLRAVGLAGRRPSRDP